MSEHREPHLDEIPHIGIRCRCSCPACLREDPDGPDDCVCPDCHCKASP